MKELEAFMALAKDLKVRGLKQTKLEKKPSVDNRKRGLCTRKKQKTKPSDVSKGEEENWLKLDYSTEPEVILENDSSDLSLNTDTMAQEVNDSFEPDILVENDSPDLSLKLEDPSELDEKVASLLTWSLDNIWQCTECSYGSKTKGHVKEHVEKHIEGITIPCQTCPKVFSKRSTARRHSCKL